MKFSSVLGLVASASAVFADVTLREAAKDFMFGVAANTEYFNDDPAYLESIQSTFNTIVAENGCKFSNIHPEKDVYDFTDCDAHLTKAEEFGMQFRGHCLLWHGFQPEWLQALKGEDLKNAIVDHITNVLNHYKGKVHIWDVVNEAVDDESSGENGTWDLRQTNFAKEVPDFIDVAFKTAREVDPTVKLFYNDYNIEGDDISEGKKTNAVYNLLKDMKERGVPVDGVGLQYHLHTDIYPQYENVVKAMAKFGELGLEVQVTEIDVNSRHGATQEVFEFQADLYADALKACLESKNCTGFLIWGVDDPHSWRAEGVPLIFDAKYTPKPAYYSLLNVFKKYHDIASESDEEVDAVDGNDVDSADEDSGVEDQN